MADMPLVSVVMPVYNGEKYLKPAVASILNQTFRDFEFLIINDGSTDRTGEILRDYKDPRIIIINNENNLGLVRSRNKGLDAARGKYIATIDADDVALPERLAKQVNFLNRHREIGILGSYYYQVDYPGRKVKMIPLPENDLQVRWISLLGCPFGHSTIMLRRDILVRNKLHYDASFPVAEDYELWTRVLKYTRGANLREPLLIYRMHGENVTSKKRISLLANQQKISLRTIHEQLPEFRFDLERISALRDLLAIGKSPLSDFKGQFLELSELYLNMLSIFVKHHSGERNLHKLRREESLKVLRLIFRSRNQPGWSRVFRRILAMDPAIPFLLPGYLLTVVVKRIKRWLNISKRLSIKL